MVSDIQEDQSYKKMLFNKTWAAQNRSVVRMDQSNAVNQTYVIPSNAANNTADVEENYDSEGAMQFIIATVLVYSVFGVFCTLLSRIKRGRGRSHQNMLQDESINKYLKKSKTLKFDGYKMKLMYECSKYTDEIRRFEEKMRLRELEREMSSMDYSRTAFLTQHPGKPKKKDKRKMSGIGAVGKMGLSLFYIGDLTPSRNSSSEHVPMMETRIGETSHSDSDSVVGKGGGPSKNDKTVKAIVTSPPAKSKNILSQPWTEEIKIKSKSDMSIRIEVEDVSDTQSPLKETGRNHLVANNEVSQSTRSLETGL